MYDEHWHVLFLSAWGFVALSPCIESHRTAEQSRLQGRLVVHLIHQVRAAPSIYYTWQPTASFVELRGLTVLPSFH